MMRVKNHHTDPTIRPEIDLGEGGERGRERVIEKESERVSERESERE